MVSVQNLHAALAVVVVVEEEETGNRRGGGSGRLTRFIDFSVGVNGGGDIGRDRIESAEGRRCSCTDANLKD